MMATSFASLAGVVLGVIALRTGKGPLHVLSVGIDYARAGGFMAREMAEGAWARLSRWQECLDKSRRSA